MTGQQALASALEFIADRSKAIAEERIRELESLLATANAQIVSDRQRRHTEAIGMHGLTQSVEDCAAHFAQVIDSAKDEIPLRAKAQIADLEKRLATAQADTEAARRDRDDARRIAEGLVSLRDACLRWDTDHYSPRLKNAIAAFRRLEVSKR